MNSPLVDIHTHHAPKPPDAGIRSILLREAGQLFPITEMFSTGMHPWDADRFDDPKMERLLAVLEALPHPAAIGEIGLDYVREVDHMRQEKLFIRQLEIAARRDLPVIIHCVRAFSRTMEVLEKFDLKGVVFHGFTGSAGQAIAATDKGYYISYGERSLRSPSAIEALAHIPLDRLFLETDESEVPIAEIYIEVAKYLNISMEKLTTIIYDNYKTLFP